MKRTVVPEILDHLPHDDPEAQRSRRDLKLINFLMGNHRWFRRQLRGGESRVIIELGSGSGELLTSLARPERKTIGMDLTPRPIGLPGDIDWISGDIFDTLPDQLDRNRESTAIIANLFLHHFEAEPLSKLGELMDSASMVCFSEPLRSRQALAAGQLIHPLVNRVTRHDMPVSIRAGFRQGELPKLLNLDQEKWAIREQVSVFGAYRLVATKKL